MSKKKYVCPICKAKVSETPNGHIWHDMIHRQPNGTPFPAIFGGKRK